MFHIAFIAMIHADELFACAHIPHLSKTDVGASQMLAKVNLYVGKACFQFSKD